LDDKNMEGMTMAMASSGVTFNVTTQELERKSEELSRELLTMENSYNTLRALVADSTSYWDGEAGRTFRRMFQDRQEEVDEILTRLKDHPRNLMTIAGIYKEAERKIETENIGLPTNPLD